ncbi:MAG TPA: hypothetical protein VFA89_02735 [Terriglobales bacterium]|nr:hypothetical protein [Terriglobales bacterium]
MMRHQTGCIWRDAKRRAWFGRWYQDVVQPDGTVKRKLVARKLADISDRYRTKSDVRPLLDDILRPLNEGKVDARSTMTLGSFVRKHYLPEYVNKELRPSTRNGYKKLWEALETIRTNGEALAEIALRDFTPKHLHELLLNCGMRRAGAAVRCTT